MRRKRDMIYMAPSKQVFSIASGVMNKKKASIKPTNAELLMFLHGNRSLIEWSV
jgi:hypothetical protein